MKFGLKPEDYAVNPRIEKAVKKKGDARYRDSATSNEWTGRGRQPTWFTAKTDEEQKAMRIKP
jgi:DNA-binding protein H-NS